MATVEVPQQDLARTPSVAADVHGEPLSNYPNWDPVARVLRLRCNVEGVTLASLVGEDLPDTAAVLRWVETYLTEEELDGIAVQVAAAVGEQ